MRWGPPGDPHEDEGDFEDSLVPSLPQKMSPNCDFYHLHLGAKNLMVNSSIRSVHRRSNGLVNLDLTESSWTCAIQGGCMFGSFGWKKGRPHKRKQIEF